MLSLSSFSVWWVLVCASFRIVLFSDPLILSSWDNWTWIFPCVCLYLICVEMPLKLLHCMTDIVSVPLFLQLSSSRWDQSFLGPLPLWQVLSVAIRVQDISVIGILRLILCPSVGLRLLRRPFDLYTRVVNLCTQPISHSKLSKDRRCGFAAWGPQICLSSSCFLVMFLSVLSRILCLTAEDTFPFLLLSHSRWRSFARQSVNIRRFESFWLRLTFELLLSFLEMSCRIVCMIHGTYFVLMI